MKKRFLSLALFLTLLSSLLLTPVSAASQFRDVSETDWFYEAVNEAAKLGIVNGTGDGLFSPNQQVTKLQFITMLIRAACATEPAMQFISDIIQSTNATEKANDVDYLVMLIEQEYDETYIDYLSENYPSASDENWWTKYVYCADRLGLFSNMYYEPSEIENLYNGNDSLCNRVEMGNYVYWFLWQEFLGEYDYDIDDASLDIAYSPDYAGFIPDMPTVKNFPWDADNISYVFISGIINGIDENRTFDPTGVMTRGQACQVIYKLLNEDKRTPISQEDIKQYVVDRSLKEVPEDIRGVFDKTAEEMKIDTKLWFDQLPEETKGSLDGLNYYYVENDYDTTICSFDTDNVHFYEQNMKKTIVRGYKVLDDHLLAVADQSYTEYYDEEKGTWVYTDKSLRDVNYYFFAIKDNKFYSQKLAKPNKDETCVNDVVRVYNIITAEQAKEMKTGTFSLSDAIGVWSTNMLSGVLNLKYPETTIVITEDTTSLSINGQTYSCKPLGNDRFELSANGKKDIYTMWTPKMDEKYLGMLYLKYDSNSLDCDALGIFSADNIYYYDDFREDQFFYLILCYEQTDMEQ